MTLRIFSARVSYGGSDRLDITRATGGQGLVFAPSWEILRPMLAKRRAERGRIVSEELELQRALDWAEYTELYLAEMRLSLVKWRPAWHSVLARDFVTVVCYCADARRCHRAVLRSRVLPALGAVDGGER